MCYNNCSWLWRFEHKIYFVVRSSIPYHRLVFTVLIWVLISTFPPIKLQQLHLTDFKLILSAFFFPVRSTLHTATTVSFRNPIRYPPKNIYIFLSSTNIHTIVVITTNAYHIKLFPIWPQSLPSASYFSCATYQSSSLWIYNLKPKDSMLSVCCPHVLN